MRYDRVKDLSCKDFKRLTGVKPAVYAEMLDVLREAETKKLKAGRSSKLNLEDQLMLAMSYWREYRTQFHSAASYGVHESTANRILTHVENLLIASGRFSLPKRREVEEIDWVVVLVDATESPIPIERPKKSRSVITAASRVTR